MTTTVIANESEFTPVRTAVKGLTAGLILALSTTLAVAPTASAAAPKTKACSATVSVAKPKQYSTVTIRISKLPGSKSVTTVAHYKTTNTKKTAKSNSKGQASVAYAISRATIGRKVVVNVTAQSGIQKYACSTSFVPVKR